MSAKGDNQRKSSNRDNDFIYFTIDNAATSIGLGKLHLRIKLKKNNIVNLIFIT